MENQEVYIPGYEGLYVVSKMGYVRKVGEKRRRYGSIGDRGYTQLALTGKDGKRTMYLVSRLVARAFIPNPDGRTQVDHINTDRTNNRVDNLRWVWPRENAANLKTYYNRRQQKLFRRPNNGASPCCATLPDGKVIYSNTITGLAEQLGCSSTTVSRCYHGDQPLYNGNVEIRPLPKQKQLTLF